MTAVSLVEQVRSHVRPWFVRLPVAIGMGAGCAVGASGFITWLRGPNASWTLKDLLDMFGIHLNPLNRQDVVAVTIFVAGLTYFLLSQLAGSLYEQRMERKAESDRNAAKQRSEQLEYLRANPLSLYHFCPSCGWLGRGAAPLPTFTGQRVGGAVAAVGGSGVAAAGCGAGAIGMALIVIGIPLLFFACIGIIPIIAGIILMGVGGTATTVGAAVATTGVAAGSLAKHAQHAAQQSPRQCPACRNPGLIPANSPIAAHTIATTPAIQDRAKAMVEEVLCRLPMTLNAEPPGDGQN